MCRKRWFIRWRAWPTSVTPARFRKRCSRNLLQRSCVPLKPPSAELRPDQKDTDSIPPYDVLDPILRAYVEEELSPARISEQLNISLELVKKIINLVDRNEYKRQQAAPGIKVTTKAFGIGRRFPIAQKYVE
jgi:NH3-dependent NAD+ synthetase